MVIMKSVHIFVLFLAVRLASIWMVQTWYVPDEYWQTLEVAHRMSFGYGYLTWEWIIGLRSYLYPFVIAVLYKILEFFKLDYVEILILVPRLFQALLSSYADVRFYQWSSNHKWAAFNIAISWFWFYTGSRTILNTLETSLTTIALSYFPWKGTNKEGTNILQFVQRLVVLSGLYFVDFKIFWVLGQNKFLWFVALLCIIRPTAAVPWLPICIYHLLITENKKAIFFKNYILTGVIALTFSILLDSLCHGQFVITSWQFLKFNIFHNIGSLYGSQPWHWYLSSGLPALLGIYFLPFMLAAVKTVRHKEIFSTNFILLVSIMFTLTVYSMLPHKEFRFIMPVLPMALYISSDLITRWSYKANNTFLWITASILLISNIIPAWYLGMIHQRGTIDVMKPLSQIAITKPDNTSILFLMPCHSTPLYSHIHVNVTTRFLTCEPDFANSDGYQDEADKFYENPNKWLYNNYPPNGTLPSHIVSFDNLVPMISSILSRYKPTHSFFHTNIPLSSRIGTFVIIHERVN